MLVCRLLLDLIWLLSPIMDFGYVYLFDWRKISHCLGCVGVECWLRFAGVRCASDGFGWGVCVALGLLVMFTRCFMVLLGFFCLWWVSV